MEVLDTLSDRAATLGARLHDPDVDDAGLELNVFVRDLSRIPAEHLAARRDTVVDALDALGSSAERVCSWLSRHAHGPDEQSERTRREFWASVLTQISAVPA